MDVIHGNKQHNKHLTNTHLGNSQSSIKNMNTNNFVFWADSDYSSSSLILHQISDVFLFILHILHKKPVIYFLRGNTKKYHQTLNEYTFKVLYFGICYSWANKENVSILYSSQQTHSKCRWLSAVKTPPLVSCLLKLWAWLLVFSRIIKILFRDSKCNICNIKCE